jgi:hypothetical protein
MSDQNSNSNINNTNSNINNNNSPLPNGGVISNNVAVEENCPPPCTCPPAKCYRWCIRRYDENTFEASNGIIKIMANSEKSLLSLITKASEKEYVTSSPTCECPDTTNCGNKTYTPFSCVSREWVVQVEYRPDCNQYFGDFVPQKRCVEY